MNEKQISNTELLKQSAKRMICCIDKIGITSIQLGVDLIPKEYEEHEEDEK